MKKLIALVPTKGKTQKEIATDVGVQLRKKGFPNNANEKPKQNHARRSAR